MTHQEKLAHFEQLLETRGLWKSNAMPPAFRLLWALGVKVPPPYFLTFRQAVIGLAPPFGLACGAIVALALWFFDIAEPAQRISTSCYFGAVSGIGFGIAMAYVYRWYQGRLQLPSWENFPDSG